MPISAKDFAFLHEAPTNVLVDSIQPAISSGQIYNLRIKSNLCAFRSQNVTNTVRYASDGDPFPLQLEDASDIHNGLMLLKDRTTNAVLAVLTRNFASDQYGDENLLGYNIYTFRPIYPKQRPASHMKFQGRHCTNGSKQKALISITKYGLWTSLRDPQLLSPRHWITRASECSRATTLVRPSCLRKTHGERTHWNLKVAPGVDPALMVSFTAIVDHLAAVEREKRASASFVFVGA